MQRFRNEVNGWYGIEWQITQGIEATEIYGVSSNIKQSTESNILFNYFVDFHKKTYVCSVLRLYFQHTVRDCNIDSAF